MRIGERSPALQARQRARRSVARSTPSSRAGERYVWRCRLRGGASRPRRAARAPLTALLLLHVGHAYEQVEEALVAAGSFDTADWFDHEQFGNSVAIDGNFAVVKTCVDRKTGEKLALKVIDKSNFVFYLMVTIPTAQLENLEAIASSLRLKFIALLITS